jgi:hypothetical protein
VLAHLGRGGVTDPYRPPQYVDRIVSVCVDFRVPNSVCWYNGDPRSFLGDGLSAHQNGYAAGADTLAGHLASVL